MRWLRNGEDITEEMNEIKEISKNNVESESFCQNAKKTFDIYTSRKFLKPFGFAGSLFCLYNFCGFSTVQFYMMTIFTESGSSIESSSATLLVSCWRLVVSFMSSFALHHVSRRTLFFSTAVILATSQASLGTFFYLKTLPDWKSWTNSLGWFPLFSIFSIYAGGQLGFSPITKVRGNYKDRCKIIFSYLDLDKRGVSDFYPSYFCFSLRCDWISLHGSGNQAFLTVCLLVWILWLLLALLCFYTSLSGFWILGDA